MKYDLQGKNYTWQLYETLRLYPALMKL